MNVCSECKRPWKVLKDHERARAGQFPGMEKEFAVLANTSKACNRVLVLLENRRGHFDGWVSADHLRQLLNGGDGPRRARQLRDEYGYPVEVERRSDPSQAWYRLAP